MIRRPWLALALGACNPSGDDDADTGDDTDTGGDTDTGDGTSAYDDAVALIEEWADAHPGAEGDVDTWSDSEIAADEDAQALLALSCTGAGRSSCSTTSIRCSPRPTW